MLRAHADVGQSWRQGHQQSTLRHLFLCHATCISTNKHDRSPTWAKTRCGARRDGWACTRVAPPFPPPLGWGWAQIGRWASPSPRRRRRRRRSRRAASCSLSFRLQRIWVELSHHHSYLDFPLIQILSKLTKILSWQMILFCQIEWQCPLSAILIS